MRILPIFIPHAGCRFNCIYCDQNKTSARSDTPTPEAVVSLVRKSLEYGPVDEVAYYGGSFTALPGRLMISFLDVLQPFLRSGDIGGVRLSTRPDAINADIVDTLAVYGVTTVELGCQSFDDGVLATSGRGHTASQACAAVDMLRQTSLRIGIQLMPGLPGADRDEAHSSLAAALSLSPDFLRVYPTVVLAGTRLADLWQQGKYLPLSLEEAVDLCADVELHCRESSVPVIRYGLQSNERLDAEEVLAGPYHPAFGQLVKSRVWRRALVRLQMQGISSITVHPSELSDAIGHGRCNLDYLQQNQRCFSVTSGLYVNKGFIAAGTETSSLFSLNAARDF